MARTDVVMVECRVSPRFAPESFQQFGIRQRMQPRHLQRHVPAESGVERQVDDPVAALSERPLDETADLRLPALPVLRTVPRPDQPSS
jgi:hypothetical protein